MAETPSPTARACVVGMTDVGRVREHNEDSFLVMNRADGRRGANAQRFEVALDGGLLLVVCDGMGGAAAGEVASRMAADRMAQELGKADFANSTPDQIASLMDHAVQQANVDIHEAAKANPSQKGMGTTMTAAVVTPDRLFVSQVGDSRAYLLRRSQLNQITKDQSLIGQLIEEGTLTEEEAEKLGGRNIVLQAVGVEENLRVDTKYWPVLRGDLLLVCSDGLSGMVKDAQLKEILVATAEDPAKAAENLIAEANKNGGRDNVTAIVARFDGEGLRAPMEAAGEGEIEKAGVAFKAPPPPDVPNPMKKVAWLGLAVLAVIAGLWLALRKTTADVQIAVEPADAAVDIVLKSADGKTEYKAVSKNGVASIPAVEPSKDQEFTLVASAPGCFDDERKVWIKEPGQVKLDASPTPKPGTLDIWSLKTPHVSVKIEVASTHKNVKAYDNTVDLPEAGKEKKRTFGNIPAGLVKITASSEGHQPWEHSEKLESEKLLSIEVPELTPITSHVVVKCTEQGAQAEAFDRYGVLLDKDVVTDGSAKLKVRVGRQSVRVTKTGFKVYEKDVDVAAGQDTTIEAKLDVKTMQLTLKGPPDSEFEILRQRSAEDPVKVCDGPAAGRSRAIMLEPGAYQIRWRVGNGAWKTFKHEVHVGDAPADLDLTKEQ